MAAFLAGQPRQLGQSLQRSLPARRLVNLNDGVTLAAGDRHSDDLLRQAAVIGCGDCQLVRADGPAVKVGARELQLVADLGCLIEHLAAGERVG